MNIVFAFADDWGRYAHVYGKYETEQSLNNINNFVTSNIDRIAQEGVIFQNAIVPAPTCTPCRSSLCSGRYFWQTGMGAILTGAVWDENIPTFPLLLEDAGYHIGFTYKVWSPGTELNGPFGGARNSYAFAGLKFNNFSIQATKRVPIVGVEQSKKEILDETRQNFLDFLADREEDQPFCYWWGPQNTHRAWEQGSGKVLWALEPDDLKGKMPECLPDVPEVREDFADYLGEAMAVDAGIGVLIEELERIGELDNTLFVVSGDHGIPSPGGKCNLYNLGCEVSLMIRYPKEIQAGRSVDDLVNIMDLAPTFLEMAGQPIPEGMIAKSLVSILKSKENGQVEPDRNFVVMGRERHVDCARDGYLPYPIRGLRTKDFLYVINFAPDRWPLGSPCEIDEGNQSITYEALKTDIWIAYADMDASPTKAWIVWNRHDEVYEKYYDLNFGKRQGEELYDLRSDRYTMHNLADKTEYAVLKQEMKSQLFSVLIEQKDPRVLEEDCRFEHYPYTKVVRRHAYIQRPEKRRNYPK